MNSTDKIVIGVIGAGQMSIKTHLPILQTLQEEGLCELKTICDLNLSAAQTAQQNFGFSQSTHDADEIMRDDEINTVYVFGTVEMHYQYGKKALSAGKNLFVEKPPAKTVQQVAELADIAKNQKVIAVTGFNRRFHKGLTWMTDQLEGVSDMYSIEAQFHKPALNVPVPFGAYTWFGSNAIHTIDYIAHIAGMPDEIHTSSNKAAGDVPQNFSVLLKWKSGLHAVVSSNNSAGARKENYIIHGHGVTYSCEDTKCKRQAPQGDEEKVFENNSDSRGFVGEHRAFVDAIQTGVQPIHSIETAIPSMRLVEMIEQGHSGAIEKEISIEAANDNSTEQEETLKPSHSLLILNPHALASLLPQLAAQFNLIYHDTISTLSQEEKDSVVGVITGRQGTPLQESYLDDFKNIQVVGVVGASLKKYDVEPFVEKGIAVVNVSDTYARTVAEFCLLQAMNGIRRASQSHDVMRDGGWGLSSNKGFKAFIGKMRTHSLVQKVRPILLPMWKVVKKKTDVGESAPIAKIEHNFVGRTVGLIGYGEITKAFIEILKPFNMEIGVVSEYLTDEEAEEKGIKRVELAGALQSDIISLHRGLSDRTRGNFGKKEIDMIKSGAVFINSARGELIDTDALVARLNKGDIFACLDVYDTEPLSKKHPLRKLPNVFITSHIAGSTKQMYGDASRELVAKVTDILSGKEIGGSISKDQLSNMT